MSYFAIIRGPLGVGKTTVAKALAARLRGRYISVDAILEEPGVEEWGEGYISERSFAHVNELAAPRARESLDRKVPVVFDGNFYWKSQVEDLLRRLPYPHAVFTLQAPLEVCVARDRSRPRSYGAEATDQVYRKSTEFDWGVVVDATQPLDRVISDVAAHLPPT